MHLACRNTALVLAPRNDFAAKTKTAVGCSRICSKSLGLSYGTSEAGREAKPSRDEKKSGKRSMVSASTSRLASPHRNPD
jgi:hypothetical protein